jgi:hypothetical protein
LQDVHVETFGSISNATKIEFVTRTNALTLAKQDFVRAAIVAGKSPGMKKKTWEEYKVRSSLRS